MSITRLVKVTLVGHVADKEQVLAELQGTELAGKEYEPLFGYFAHITSAFRVVNDTYVTDDSGTGVVHQAASPPESW